jgi:competence protein ComEC
MTARAPLVGPALGLLAGIAVAAQGVPFPPSTAAALPLALSPPLSPLAFAAVGWWAASSQRAVPAAVPPDEIDLEGRIASVPDRLDERTRFRLRLSDGRALDVIAPLAPWPLALGDRVRFPAVLRLPRGLLNPGGRDPAARMAASGIALQALGTGPPVRTAAPSALAWIERGRERFAAAADALPAAEAGLVRAIGTGDRAALDPGVAASFARSGLAHVLAVSGLHLVVVAFGLERALRFLLLRIDPVASRFDPRRLSAAIALPAAIAYALATGAGVPVLRAAVAAAVAFGGALLDREASAANGLALAILVLLGADPGAALDVSLQLSFAAVAGLVLWAGPLRRALPLAPAPPGSWRRRLSEPLLSGACATVAASIATAPVLAVHFRQLPLLGLAANVAGVPLGSALTAVASLAAVAASAWPPLAFPFLAAARPLASALIALSDAAAAPRWSVLGVGSPGLLGALAFAAAALLATRFRGAPRLAFAAGAAACLLLPGPLRAAAARERGGLEVVFIAVGQGDAALLRLPDGSAVLVDAGGAPDGGADPGARDVVPLLRDLGVRRLAAVFVSHPHPDHVLGLAAVADAFPIERLFSNGDLGDGGVREALSRLYPRALAPGERWDRAGVSFDVLGGARDAFTTNDASLVLRVAYGDTAFLFPGDVERAGEAAAVDRGGLRADVVKVPHHGSRTSSTPAFAAAVRPRWAVVCLSTANRFGFPHDEALAHWREVGAHVLRTDEGAVRFLSDGRRVRRVPAISALDPLAIFRERTHRTEVRIEDIDLLDLAERIRQHIPVGEPPVGYLRGRAYFRDVIVHELGCSELEAEDLVETLEMNGYLRFTGDPSVRSRATESRWEVDPHVP